MFLCSGLETQRVKTKSAFLDFCESGWGGPFFLNGVHDYFLGSAQDLEITCSSQRVNFQTFTGLGGEIYVYASDTKINVSKQRMHLQTFTSLEEQDFFLNGGHAYFLRKRSGHGNHIFESKGSLLDLVT